MNRYRFLVLLIIAGIALAAWNARLWLPPFLIFIGLNSDLIQGLTDFFQLILWIVAAIVGLLTLWRMSQKPPAQDPPQLPPTPPSGPTFQIGEMEAERDINIATDNAQIGGNRFGDNANVRDIIENQTIVQATEPVIQTLHTIPAPPADFTGREAELDELLKPMQSGGVNISGLTGMGGVGKTALAYALADLIRADYPDAQLRLDMQGATDEPRTTTDVMAAVIRAFHPTAKLPEGDSALRDAYLSVLDGKRTLLLLDDARDKEQVEPLLPPATCGLIVTSRQHFTLSGLHPLRLNTLTVADAEALLRRITPRLTETEAEELAKLCGYLPLALTLAGSALAERPDLHPAEYLRRLADERQRLELVEASLYLSYNLLDKGQQQRWRMLAIFPATFDCRAAAAIWDMNSETEVNVATDYLSTLVRYNLVEWNDKEERYRLHDLVHLFANSRVTDEERSVAHHRHSQYFLKVLHNIYRLRKRGSGAKGLTLFNVEWMNIQMGQVWAVVHTWQDDAIASLCDSYGKLAAHVLAVYSHPRERIRWLKAALIAARCLKNPRHENIHLGELGNAYADLGERDMAIDYYERAIKLSQQLGERRWEGNGLGNLGLIYTELQDAQRAIELLNQAFIIAQEVHDRQLISNLSGSLGLVYMQLGEVATAIRFYNKQLGLSREMGDSKSEGTALGNLGLAYLQLGEPDEALRLCKQQLDIALITGDRRLHKDSLRNLGRIHKNLGKEQDAIELYKERLSLARVTEDYFEEVLMLLELSNTHEELREWQEASIHWDSAISTFQQIGVRSRAARP